MNPILDIPEIRGLAAAGPTLRLPQQINVPLTERIRRIIDSESFGRLHSVSQLGLVRWVYPGATHSRFEHSLGAYFNCLQFLQHLAADPRFTDTVDLAGVEALILASLLHDIGHWPYCHPIEDIQLAGLNEHESLASRWLRKGEIEHLIDKDWSCSLERVLGLIEGRKSGSTADRLLHSILSGPIDVDKLDYLYRDSLHAGVPYGSNFDRQRLVSNLCVDSAGTGLAVTDKGRTAAELLVFARYVMFSEVYWHHAVRAATAMLQRSVFELHAAANWASLCQLGDHAWQAELIQMAKNQPAEPLVQGLFGARRGLYKRVAEFDAHDAPQVHAAIAGQPYPMLVACSERLAAALANELDLPVGPLDVLVDAPPVGLEVQFNVEVRDRNQQGFRPLGEVSPVTRALANDQFDKFVKRVRIFVRPELRAQLPPDFNWAQQVTAAANWSALI